MFGSTNFPFNFCNRRGIPMIETKSVTVTDDNVVLTLPDRSFRWLNDRGVMLLRFSLTIPTGTTATLPIVFSANDYTQPLTNLGGDAITVAQLSNTGVYLVYYDKGANVMQLLTTEIPTA